MTTINITLPGNSYSSLEKDPVFSSLVKDLISDYLEKKQDIATREELESNDDFLFNVGLIEQKLGK